MFFSDAEDGQRQADFVIEIAFGLQYVKMLSENRGNHFFCAGLAYAAGDPHHRNGQSAAVAGCDGLDGFQCGRNLDIGSGRLLRRVLTEDAGCALGEDGRNEGMAVNPLAFYGHEEIAGLYFAAVNDHAVYLDSF